MPAPLHVAAALVAVEGLVFVGYAALEIVNLAGTRLVMGVTTTAFFVAYGVALLLCARAVVRGHSWGRSPIVLAQLIQVLVAWGFRGGSTTVVAVALVVVAVLVLVGLLHPASIAALDRPGAPEDDG